MSNPDFIKTLENPSQAPADPFDLFRLWLTEAEQAEAIDFNAMCLATIDAEGMPGVRVVLLKGFDPEGFIFYTNRESSKGQALAAHPAAGLNFYWKTLGRQICIQGAVEQVGGAESDAYFATRPRGSRIGAWASRQSRPLENRAALAARVKEYEDRFAGQDEIPRPPHWGGYRLRPSKIEFWHAGDFRLHTRLVYSRAGNGWERKMLFP